MNRAEIVEKISKELRSLGINNFQCDNDVMVLNKAFANGYCSTDIKSFHGINYYGINSIGIYDTYFVVSGHLNGYGNKETKFFSNNMKEEDYKYCKYRQMNDEQFNACCAYFNSVIKAKKKMNDMTKDNAPLETIIGKLNDILNDILKDTEFHSTIGYGHRNNETNADYYALIIKYDDNSQRGSMKITQDRFGAYWVQNRTIFGGDGGVHNFTIENAREIFKEILW